MARTGSVPPNGTWPVSISYTTTPQPYTSERSSPASPITCSGLRYSGVPSGGAGSDQTRRRRPAVVAAPKSPSTRSRLSVRRRLPGLRSRWTMPRLWMWSSACASCRLQRTTRSIGRGVRPGPTTCVDAAAGGVVEHQVGPAVALVDVAATLDVRVAKRFRELCLTSPARHEHGVVEHARVRHFECDNLACAKVARSVDVGLCALGEVLEDLVLVDAAAGL